MTAVAHDRLRVGGYSFDCRPGTSDAKVVRETFERRPYWRRDFYPRPGEYWLDVGAYIGTFSIWAASHGAQVLAFEPDPASYALACHNVALNGLDRQITLMPYALTTDPVPGYAPLYRNVARGKLWRNSLHKRWRGHQEIMVATQPIAPLWRPDTHIKLDIEGSEMPILEAMADQRAARLVYEWSFYLDPDIDRYRRVVRRLRETYQRVIAREIDPSVHTWPRNWYPQGIVNWCD